MKVNYSGFFTGERRPFVKSQGEARSILDKYVSSGLVGDALSELGRTNKVEVTDRRRGVKLVLTSTTKRTKVKSKASEFLRITLDGRQSETQIIVAAVDKLKTSAGWHRVVCEVEANGLVYKVKSHHKGVSWTDAASNATIVSKRAA